MKRVLIATTALLFSLTAFAGKTEREYMKNEVAPAVKDAEAKFKSSCGCALKINVSDTLKTTDDMAQAKHTSESISEGAPKYCNDDASKKAMCALKSIDVTKGTETKFTFKGGKGTVTTEGQSYVSWDMITREIDK